MFFDIFKDKAEKVNAKVDAKADSWGAKLLDSKWTGAVVLAVVVVLWIL
jgi:hypothetical protein